MVTMCLSILHTLSFSFIVCFLLCLDEQQESSEKIQEINFEANFVFWSRKGTWKICEEESCLTSIGGKRAH